MISILSLRLVRGMSLFIGMNDGCLGGVVGGFDVVCFSCASVLDILEGVGC